MAIGDWATYYAARTEFSAAEALHKKGLLEKREIPCGKRKVHEYRYAPSNDEGKRRGACEASALTQMLGMED